MEMRKPLYDRGDAEEALSYAEYVYNTVIKLLYHFLNRGHF